MRDMEKGLVPFYISAGGGEWGVCDGCGWIGVIGRCLSASIQSACLAPRHCNTYIYEYHVDKIDNKTITFDNGSLGSCSDEERSKVRKVMRFARTCESSSI